MKTIEQLFANNHAWATKMKDEQSILKSLPNTKIQLISGLAVQTAEYLLKN